MSQLSEFDTVKIECNTIRTGSVWEWQIELNIKNDETGEITPLELDSAEALLQLRRTPADAQPLITVTHLAGITLGGNTIAVSIPSTQTILLIPGPARLVWDLKLRLPGGDWWTPVEGTVAVVLGVSR
jgi:hypothetical protein